MYKGLETPKKGLVLAIMLGGAAMASYQAHAVEIRYVIDQLTLNMYSDTSLSERMDPLKSGDKVQILQVGDGYSQVKTQDGTVGWVKSSYLDKEKPAALQLQVIQQELDALRSKHTDLLIEKSKAPSGSTDKELKTRLTKAESARQKAELRIGELEKEKAEHLTEIQQLKREVEATGSDHFLLIWVILPILTLITGFFVGVRFLDKKIRARFGGFSPV